VPQLLAEIDGVEHLKNVIVIGASNRQGDPDRSGPSCGRGGSDVKIKIERPDAAARGGHLQQVHDHRAAAQRGGSAREQRGRAGPRWRG